MAEKMTRAEQRGILQQLVKQQQATLGLAEVIAVDAELEAGIGALRTELVQLKAEIEKAKLEVDGAKASMSDAGAAASRAWDASIAAQQELAETRKAVDTAKRQAESEIKQIVQSIEVSRQAQLNEVQQAVASRRDAAEAAHAERLLVIRRELEALEDRKESISREIAGMLSRFSAS